MNQIVTELTTNIIFIAFIFLIGYEVIEFNKTKKIKINNFWFWIIFIVAFAVRIYKITEIPYGLNVDEAGMAYDAWSLANFGYDRYMISFPVYLINFSSGQSALYAYLCAILIKFFGLSTFVIRMPAFILSMTTIYVLYHTSKKLVDENFALLVTFILSIIPWHILQSRFGLDCNLMSSMLTLSVCSLLTAKSWKGYCVTGVLFGLTLYSYALSYFIVPTLLFCILLYMFWVKKIKLTSILIMSIPLFIVALPLMLFVYRNTFGLDELKIGLMTITKMPVYRSSEISFENLKDFGKLFNGIFKTDFYYNAFPPFETIYPMSFPLLFFGVILALIEAFKSIKDRKFSLISVLFICFVVIYLCLSLVHEVRVYKANSIFIFSICLIAYLIYFLSKRRSWMKWIFIGLYLLNFLSFKNYYFNGYAKDNKYQYLFDHGFQDLMGYIETLELKNDIYFDKTVEQPYIFAILAQKITPQELKELIKDKDLQYYNYINYGNYIFHLPENFVSRANYVVLKNDNRFDYLLNEGYGQLEYGEYKIFSPIK